MADALTDAVRAIMAEASATAIQPHFRALSTADVTRKAHDDVVTIADHASEALLTERLAKLLPEAKIVGEEAAHADATVLDWLSDDLCWIIDPLDGTNNFANGSQPYGILVALAEAGETIAGWIYDCTTGRFCHALRNIGAFINGEQVHAKSSGKNPPIAAISTVFLKDTERALICDHIAPRYSLVDIPRCAAEQYPRLVLGQNDVSLFERTLAWDHAAGILFLNEAGGKAARLDGSTYRVDSKGSGLIGASTPALFDGLAAQLLALNWGK